MPGSVSRKFELEECLELRTSSSAFVVGKCVLTNSWQFVRKVAMYAYLATMQSLQSALESP